MPNSDWVPFLSLLAFTMVAITAASWKLYLTISAAIDGIRKEMTSNAIEIRREFSHQIEAAVAVRRKETDDLRQTLRDQDTKMETFRREMTTAANLSASKDDLRRVDTKLDILINTVGMLAADISAIRGRELLRAQEGDE